MKKIVSVFLFTMALVFISCNDDESQKNSDSVDSFAISIDSVQSIQMRKAISLLMTRSGGLNNANITEEEAEDVIAPFVARGRSIQRQILTFSAQPENYGQVPSADLEVVESLSDSQLAVVAIATDVWMGNIEPYSLDGSNLTVDQMVSCLSAAIGLSAINELAEDLSVRSAVIVIKAVAKKSGLGAISVALLIYDFFDCIYG